MSKNSRARHSSAQPPQGWGQRAEGMPRPGDGQERPHGVPHEHRRPPPPPRKHGRVFFWCFLALQIMFLVWIIAGITSAGGTPDSCEGLTGDSLEACENAGTLGTTIGVGLILAFWMATDVIVSLTYLMYRMVSGQRHDGSRRGPSPE
ncbi:hypothetical protein AB0I94_33960 [Streptomyces sp. NPDC050147]|uniref:hypothetical protein n=1 Tax=Streptomyces sp. NPDC050147 TaxID=3155513 RepID=UPI0034305B00